MSFNTKNTHERKKEAVIVNLNTSLKKSFRADSLLKSWQKNKRLFSFFTQNKSWLLLCKALRNPKMQLPSPLSKPSDHWWALPLTTLHNILLISTTTCQQRSNDSSVKNKNSLKQQTKQSSCLSNEDNGHAALALLFTVQICWEWQIFLEITFVIFGYYTVSTISMVVLEAM